MAGCRTTHWQGCSCVLRRLLAYRKLVQQLSMVRTTLEFYANGDRDEGCMAGLTLAAVNFSGLKEEHDQECDIHEPSLP